MALSFFLFVTLILKTEYNVYEKRRIYEKDNYKYNSYLFIKLKEDLL